jgi:diguanylate cyclase (GGDEF)-like protein/PAS domain S-box-containing protein
MNLATVAAFIILACVVMYSFFSIEEKAVEVTNQNMESVISNSRIARELSTLFSEIDLFNYAFSRDKDYLESEGNRLADRIEELTNSTTNPELKNSLLILSDNFDSLIAQSTRVNSVLDTRLSLDREAHLELTVLENLIGGLLIDATLAGKDTSFVTQQLTLVIGYRESLLSISKLFAELGFDLHTDYDSEITSPIISAIDDLSLRLQAMSASFPEVALHGEHVEQIVKKYKPNVLDYFAAVEELNRREAVLDNARLVSLNAMESIDTAVSRTAKSTTDSIKNIILSYGVIVLILIFIVIVVLYSTTAKLIRFNIRDPMQTLLSGIASYSKGDFKNQITLSRNDEWGFIGGALNDMASALHESYRTIQKSRDDLEIRVEERTRELSETVEALSRSSLELMEAQSIAHLGSWSWNIETGDPFEVEMNLDLYASHLHPQDSDRVQAATIAAIEQDTHYSVEYRILRRDGTQRWVEEQARVLKGDNGHPIGMIGTILDSTERKRVEGLLREERERAQVTLHSIGDAVISTDAEGYVEYLNPVAEMMTGYTVDEARGKPLQQIFNIINEETRETVADPAARCLKEGKIIGLANHTVLVSKSGAEYAIQDSAAPILGLDGEVLGVVLVFSDVSEARRLTKQVSYQASHDMLTGLINRHEFENRLDRVLETARSLSTDNALCYLDLDQFKLVNDTCGHLAGDELLRQIGKILQDKVRHRDTVARLGGDEFGLLMEHCTLKEARQVANKLVEAISGYTFSWEKQSFNVGVSIGLIVVNESSPDINALLSAVDTACYMAKEQGRSRIHVYREDDEELAKRHGEMQWAVRLPRALEDGQFQLYLQPIVPVVGKHDGSLHYEILLRLKDKPMVLPGTFLPAADRYNLSSKIDRWVITATFDWIFNHPAHLQRLNLCAINLSGHSLNDETFLDFVHRQFEEFPIPPEKICFEITETVAIANLSRTAAFMNVLKDRGCRFSLDDFGSGLSSFAYLKNLPVDFLKIDGAFVKDILHDPLDQALVKSISEVGHVMGKRIIAEFVEDEATLMKLREIGVDYAQGYGIARPRPLEDEETRQSKGDREETGHISEIWE